MTSEPVTPRPCRAGGEIFYTPTIPPVPEPDICHDHWYAEQIDAATASYQPLIDALHDTTGLHSTVWQSGGMTMTLLTGPEGAEPYQGRHYLTLVEQFNPDATLEGSTGWYDCDRDPNTEGEQVLLADSSLASTQTRHHGHGVVVDHALTRPNGRRSSASTGHAPAPTNATARRHPAPRGRPTHQASGRAHPPPQPKSPGWPPASVEP